MKSAFVIVALLWSAAQAQTMTAYYCKITWNNKDHPGYVQHFVEYEKRIFFPISGANHPLTESKVFEQKTSSGWIRYDLNNLTITQSDNDYTGRCFKHTLDSK